MKRLDNKFLENRILEMKAAIEAGSTISVTAINSKIFTPLVIQMIAVGEETGRIDELLLEVSDFYDREVDYDLKTLTARIEPLLLVIVAGMVMVLALRYLPANVGDAGHHQRRLTAWSKIKVERH